MSKTPPSGTWAMLEDVDQLVVAEAAGLHRAVRDGLVHIHRRIAVTIGALGIPTIGDTNLSAN